MEHVQAEIFLLAEEQNDHLDMARELVNLDDGADVPRERPIDHPHLLPFSRERRCLSMLVHVVTPSSVRQVSDRAPSQALHLPLSIYNAVARRGIRGEFYLHSAELLPHFQRIVRGCDCGHRRASAQETRAVEAVSRWYAL